MSARARAALVVSRPHRGSVLTRQVEASREPPPGHGPIGDSQRALGHSQLAPRAAPTTLTTVDPRRARSTAHVRQRRTTHDASAPPLTIESGR